MVRLNSPRGNQVVPDLLGEGKVGQSIAVDVAQLGSSKPEFDPPEPVLVGSDSWPTCNFVGDLVTCAQRGLLSVVQPQLQDTLLGASKDLDLEGFTCRVERLIEIVGFNDVLTACSNDEISLFQSRRCGR